MKTFSFSFGCSLIFASCSIHPSLHVFDIQDILLTAQKAYDNPYIEVECWVDLKGPNFDKRIYGFWDGGSLFKVRVVATEPGEWFWTSGSNQPDDPGLNGQKGTFTATPWTDQEKEENPNRRGFIHSTKNGHALAYADGTPFFLVGDTWWSMATWRYPLTGVAPTDDYVPGPGISLEQALAFRQRQGYNSIALIAAFPNWDVDEFPEQFTDNNGVGIRQAWEKNGAPTAKDMHSDNGHRPFFDWDEHDIVPDYNRINPEYFRDLDKKMSYMANIGFVPFLETIRRDHGPSMKAYFDWPDVFVRYDQYIAARYGAYNLIFSPIHLDWIPPVYSLSADEFDEAIEVWYKKYGPLPYGQPVTTLIDGSTLPSFGHGDESPWLTMHSVGNNPRNHGFYPEIEKLFQLEPPLPAANLEPYYPGWGHVYHNKIDGQIPGSNSDLDNYYGRAQMYGSVLSGGLAGHVYGTGAYCGNTTGEPEEDGARPFIWEALNYDSGPQMGYMKDFVLSQGASYQKLELASHDLEPRYSAESTANGLTGWSFMMRTPEKDFALFYFERKAELPIILNMKENSEYIATWFNPRTGEWLEPIILKSSENGSILLSEHSKEDWALRIIAK